MNSATPPPVLVLCLSRDWIKFNKYIDNWLGAFLALNQGQCTNINCTIVTFQFHCDISIPLTWLTYGHHRLWTIAWRQSDTRPLLVLYTDGLVQDRSISIANTLEIPQSCIKSPGYISLHMSFIYYTHCHFICKQVGSSFYRKGKTSFEQLWSIVIVLQVPTHCICIKLYSLIDRKPLFRLAAPVLLHFMQGRSR